MGLLIGTIKLFYILTIFLAVSYIVIDHLSNKRTKKPYSKPIATSKPYQIDTAYSDYLKKMSGSVVCGCSIYGNAKVCGCKELYGDAEIRLR